MKIDSPSLVYVHLLQLGRFVYRKKYGKTALMLAAEWGRLEVVKVLVQAGADKEKQDQVSVV
jgi:hypothetical protein